MLSRAAFIAGGAACCAARARPADAHAANDLVRFSDDRPAEWTSATLDGPPFRLSDYRGKVVFVNVFAPWCGTCRIEQPDVVAFANAHARDTVVIGLAVSDADDAVRAYRAAFDIPYPIAIDRDDATRRAVYRDGKLAYPATVVFRPDGRLANAWVGDKPRAWFERERTAALGDAPA